MNALVSEAPAPARAAFWRDWHVAGLQAIGRGDFRLAAEWLEHAAAALPAGDATPSAVQTWAHLAYALMRRGKTESAAEHARRALSLLGEPTTLDDHLAAARAHHVLADECQSTRAHDACRDHAAKALAGYARQPAALADQADVHLHLASVAENSGDDETVVEAFDAAILALETARQIEIRSTTPAGQEFDCRSPASQRRSEAVELLVGRRFSLAAAYVDTASARIRLSRFREADQFLRKWQALVPQLPDEPPSPVIVRDGAIAFAGLLRILNRPEQSRQLIDQARQLVCSEPVAGDVGARLEIEDAQWQLDYGCLRCADERLARVAESSLGDPALQAQQWLTHALRWLIGGDHLQSSAFLDRILKLHDAPPLIRQLARCANTRLLSLRRQSLTAKGEIHALLQEIQQSNRKFSLNAAIATLSLAECLAAGNDLIAAAPIAQKALRMLEMLLGARHPALGDPLRVLAESAWAVGNTTCGRNYCDEADRHCGDGPVGTLARARTAAIRGRLRHLEGEFHAAAAEFHSALCGYAQLVVDPSLPHPESGFVLLDLGTIAAGCDDGDAATDRLAQGEALLRVFFGRADLFAFELVRRGNVFYELRRFKEAAWLYARAHEVYLQSLGSGHEFTRQAAENLQQALDKQNTLPHTSVGH